MTNKKITIILLVLLLIGVSSLLYILKADKELLLYKKIEEILQIEHSAFEITKEISQLIKQEDELFYVIKSIGEENHDISDVIKQVKNNIKNTKESFEKLDKKNQNIQAIFPELQEIVGSLEDKNKKELAEQLLQKEEKRWDLFNKMHRKYQEVFKMQEILYDNLSKSKISFDEINMVMKQLEEGRKGFNKYAKQFNQVGKEINIILKKM